MTQTDLNRQLKKLRDSGYVTSIAVGREAHYAIAEPLMRLVLEVKDAQDLSVQLWIRFLKYWFSSRALMRKNRPREFIRWLDSLSPLLDKTPELQRCKHTLTVVKNYLDNDNDENQLLVLQKEERELVKEGLGLIELF